MNKIVVSVGRKLQTAQQYENISIFTSLEIETPEEVGSEVYNTSYANLWVKAYEEIDKQEKALEEIRKAKIPVNVKYAEKPKDYTTPKPEYTPKSTTYTPRAGGSGKENVPASEKQIKAVRAILMAKFGGWPGVNKYLKDTFNKKATELSMADVDKVFKLGKGETETESGTSVLCEQCSKEITDSKVVEYSQQKYNTILCRECQKSYQNIEQ
jgi:hypothetical protein